MLCTIEEKEKEMLSSFALFVDNNWEECGKQFLRRQASLIEQGDESGVLMAVNCATTALKTASESQLDMSRT
jgi:hypothetical protein